MKERRLRAVPWDQRWRVQGPPGESFTIAAVSEEDAREHAQLYMDNHWKLWQFCGGVITVKKMTVKEIKAEEADIFFNFG